MKYFLKVMFISGLIITAVFGFIYSIAYAVEHSEKCTCEMVKNHECLPKE